MREEGTRERTHAESEFSLRHVTSERGGGGGRSFHGSKYSHVMQAGFKDSESVPANPASIKGLRAAGPLHI